MQTWFASKSAFQCSEWRLLLIARHRKRGVRCTNVCIVIGLETESGSAIESAKLTSARPCQNHTHETTAIARRIGENSHKDFA